jgi:hypothetical protein
MIWTVDVRPVSSILIKIACFSSLFFSLELVNKGASGKNMIRHYNPSLNLSSTLLGISIFVFLSAI